MTCRSVFAPGKPTWLQRSQADSYYQSDPLHRQANPVEINITFVFHPFLETTHISNGQLGLPKTQLTVSAISEVIPLGVKLKVAVLSIHSWIFVYTACFIREVIAYECTHVWASKKVVFVKLAHISTERVKARWHCVMPMFFQICISLGLF
jgi:hypothetical protein